LGRLMLEKALARGDRVVGADAYAGIRKALNGRIEELDRQKGVAISADFAEEELARL
jgi:hypothetical protein